MQYKGGPAAPLWEPYHALPKPPMVLYPSGAAGAQHSAMRKPDNRSAAATISGGVQFAGDPERRRSTTQRSRSPSTGRSCTGPHGGAQE
jgi:hypothetical protein